MDTNLLKLNKELIESKQSNVGEQIATQVGNVFSALKKFEDDTEALAIENADLLEADAIGVDLLPDAGKEFIYGEFTRIGEEMADAVNRKDKKRIRDLKLEGANLIAAQNTIGQMLKDHANDLFGTGGEGNYSKGSNKLMMNMLMNKEYSIRKDGKEMVIDFNGPNGKKGVKITDLDKHVYLKMDDLAVNYDNEIKNIRRAAINGLPFEKDAFAKVVNQTLNTVPKLVSSIWDDSFTLKDGKTMKELWEADPINAGKDANQYLRSGGDNWDESAVREFAKEKLMQGGTNDFTAYSPNEGPGDGDGDLFKNYEYISFGNDKIEGAVAQKLFDDITAQSQVTDPKNGTKYIFNSDGWYNGEGTLVAKTNDDLVENVFQIFDKRFYDGKKNKGNKNRKNLPTSKDVDFFNVFDGKFNQSRVSSLESQYPGLKLKVIMKSKKDSINPKESDKYEVTYKGGKPVVIEFNRYGETNNKRSQKLLNKLLKGI